MRGCLIVHGLTETPACVSSLKDRLAASGYKVASPCLAGHGGTIDDLKRSTWRQWYETVRISYNELRKSAEKIYYVGNSLGSLLGLKLALDEGWGLRALALIGTPIVLTRMSALFVPLVRYTPLRYAFRFKAKNFEKTVHDPEGRLFYKACTNTHIPSNSIFELVDLQHLLLKDLKKISNPLLLLHASTDHIAPVRNVEIIKNNVSSQAVETIVFENSGHVIPLDYERIAAADRIVKFFERFA
jgi:carboxylesterase